MRALTPSAAVASERIDAVVIGCDPEDIGFGTHGSILLRTNEALYHLALLLQLKQFVYVFESVEHVRTE